MVWFRQFWAIVRREVSGYFHAPIAYVFGVMFLVVQGVSFWATVKVLADPSQRAPYGAVLRSLYGGTFLYWVVLIVVVSVISMRLLAEERRSGIWEALMTTPVREGTVILAKWFAAVLFLVVLWLPTLLFLGVLNAHTPVDVGLDFGPILGAYIGVVVIATGFLGVGIAASAATTNQIIAAMITFSLLLGLVLVGHVRMIAAAWFADWPVLSQIAAVIDVRAHMDAFARGAIEVRWLVLHTSVAVVGVSLAAVLATLGRKRSSIRIRRAISMTLIVVIAILGNAIATQYGKVWDLTRNQVNTLDERTLAILAEIRSEMDVLVVPPQDDVFAPEFAEVDRVVRRFATAQPLLRYRVLDPVLKPSQIDEFAREFALAPADLRQGGLVVFQSGERRRAVDLLDIAGFDRDSLGVGTMSRFRAEEAFASAIMELGATDTTTICFPFGHGEYRIDRVKSPWSTLAQRLKRDGIQIESLARLPTKIPPQCTVVALVGAQTPLRSAEVISLANFLNAGGRLFVALRSLRSNWREIADFPVSGLAVVLADYGISLPSAVVVDPAFATDRPFAWTTVSGYGQHPITSAFQDRRVTVWWRPRSVIARAPELADVEVTELVRSSSTGWGGDKPCVFG